MIALIDKLPTIISLYGAAFLSFVASAVRDYCAVNFTDDAAMFFVVLYISGLSSSFIINYISFSNKLPSGLGMVAIYFCVCLLVVYLSYIKFGHNLWLIFYQLCIVALWISGSMSARRLFYSRKILLSKSREMVASVIAILMIIFSNDIWSSFLFGVFLSTIIYWFLARSCKESTSKMHCLPAHGIKWHAYRFFLSNFVVLSAFVWAIIYTDGFSIYGYNIDYLIRVSVYIFQAVTIASPVFILFNYNNPLGFFSPIIVIIMVIFVFVITLLNPGLGVLVMPIMLGLAQLISVFELNSNKLKLGVK